MSGTDDPMTTAANGKAEARLRTLSTTSRRRVAWTPGLILRRILERERAGLSVKASAVQRDAAGLAGAAQRHFGSWSRAVTKAHRAANGQRTVYTQETIIALLREHAATGASMSTNHPLTKLCYKPAVRLFGSWNAAVKAAGLEPRVRRQYSSENILAVLRERSRRGESVSSRHPDMRRYLGAAKRLFGSWTKAREEAGCGCPKQYTRDEVVAALGKILDAGRSPHIRDPDVRPYVHAARRIFGKWREALRKAQEQLSERMLRAPP